MTENRKEEIIELIKQNKEQYLFENMSCSANELSTNCIVCDCKINLGDNQSCLVPRICDDCKRAVMFARRFLENIDASIKDNQSM